MKNIYKRVTVLLLVFALAVTAASGLQTAWAVDLTASCSLTVHPGHSESGDLEENATIVLDIYQVARAVAVEGYDTYTFKAIDPYEALVLDDVRDKETWRELSQQAAEIALSGNDYPFANGASTDTKISSLEPGLYLVIARGADEMDYRTTVTDESGNERIATIAKTASHVYTYAPELVALPGKNEDENGNLIGEWFYDGEISLKPEESERCGSLKIIKSLTGFVTGRPATFVFKIEARLDEELVYSDVVSMTFTGVEEKAELIENIPVGAVVTVTEVYSGGSYRFVTEEEQMATIEAETIASVSFVNEPTDSSIKSGGITNRFQFSDEDDRWVLTQIPHDL